MTASRAVIWIPTVQRQYLENFWSRASTRPVSRWSRALTGTVDCLLSCVTLYPLLRTRSSQQLVVSDEKVNQLDPRPLMGVGDSRRT